MFSAVRDASASGLKNVLMENDINRKSDLHRSAYTSSLIFIA